MLSQRIQMKAAALWSCDCARATEICSLKALVESQSKWIQLFQVKDLSPDAGQVLLGRNSVDITNTTVCLTRREQRHLTEDTQSNDPIRKRKERWLHIQLSETINQTHYTLIYIILQK